MAQPSIPAFLEKLAGHDPSFVDLVLRVRQEALYTDGALDIKTKLLIAFALDAARGLEEGMRLLAERAREAGATEAELVEVVRVVYSVGGLQNLSMAVRALRSEGSAKPA